MSVFKRRKHVYFIGIGGIGMSGLAEILLSMGHRVTGSDRQLSEITDYLQAQGARIFAGHHAENVRDVDFLIYSSAIPKDNPELRRAREMGIPTMRRAELLGQIFNRHFGIAVAGTHGKTTTTAMIGQILLQAALDPTIIVGGRLHNLMTNARLGGSDYLIAEADEYDRSFLTLFPRIAVMTSLEADHLDIYRDLDDLKRAFAQFAHQVTFDGVIIFCNEDGNLQSIQTNFKNTTLTYGLNDQSQIWAAHIQFKEDQTLFEVHNGKERLGTITLQVPGEHNVLNALAAITVGLELEIDFKTIARGLAEFKGVERRFEKHGLVNDILIVDDYAHHPTEIKATLQGARNGWQRRIVAVFQPHLFSRTRDFYNEFAQALQQADLAVVTDIYPAREEPIPGVTGALITNAMGPKGHFLKEKEDVFAFLKRQLRPGDLLLFMGAGTINKWAEDFKDYLTKVTNNG